MSTLLNLITGAISKRKDSAQMCSKWHPAFVQRGSRTRQPTQMAA